MLRLVQLVHPSEGRRVAVVEEPHLRLLANWCSVYELRQQRNCGWLQNCRCRYSR